MDIEIYYQRDPSYMLYSNTLNLLGRDFWNSRLDQRTFLIQRPPVQNFTHPQTTDWCNYRNNDPEILTDFQNTAQAQQYFQQFLASTQVNLGLPTTDNNFCSYQELCKPVNITRSQSTVPAIPTNNRNRSSQALQKIHYQTTRPTYPIGVTSVKRNVDSESVLRSLHRYDPRDTAVAVKSMKALSNSILNSQVNPKTPMLWNNVTRRRMSCPEHDTLGR